MSSDEVWCGSVVVCVVESRACASIVWSCVLMKQGSKLLLQCGVCDVESRE